MHSLYLPSWVVELKTKGWWSWREGCIIMQKEKQPLCASSSIVEKHCLKRQHFNLRPVVSWNRKTQGKSKPSPSTLLIANPLCISARVKWSWLFNVLLYKNVYDALDHQLVGSSSLLPMTFAHFHHVLAFSDKSLTRARLTRQPVKSWWIMFTSSHTSTSEWIIRSHSPLWKYDEDNIHTVILWNARSSIYQFQWWTHLKELLTDFPWYKFSIWGIHTIF